MSAVQASNNVDQSDTGPRKPSRRARTLYHVWKDGPLSRGRLAELLGLNLPAVSNCLTELLASGDLIEEGYADSTGGRKPQLIDINPSKGAVVGLTFSSRGISSSWADLRGSIRNLQILPFAPADGKAKTLDRIFEAIDGQLKCVASECGGQSPVVQIGIGVSGLVNRVAGVSNVFPRFDEWIDVPLRGLVESRFGISTTLDSHIAAIALAESIFGNYRGMQNALYVQLGPGLGLGIVIGGTIYRGSKINVGEFGHTTVTENGPICYCGNYGCLESIASDYALIQQAEAAIREGVSTRIPEFSPQPGRITPYAIFRAASEGDRFALNLVERVGHVLGTGIANLVNLFGPELIILGGTMSAAGDLLLNPICHTLHTKALDRMEKGVEIRTSSFGKEEAIKGAVTLALHQHFTRELSGAPRTKASDVVV